MKNLKNYNKVQLQKLEYRLYIWQCNKLCYEFHRDSQNSNLIGFEIEIIDTLASYDKNNFYRYDHIVDYDNKKLWKKYPDSVSKLDYKKWLKAFYKWKT